MIIPNVDVSSSSLSLSDKFNRDVALASSACGSEPLAPPLGGDRGGDTKADEFSRLAAAFCRRGLNEDTELRSSESDLERFLGLGGTKTDESAESVSEAGPKGNKLQRTH